MAELGGQDLGDARRRFDRSARIEVERARAAREHVVDRRAISIRAAQTTSAPR